LGRNPRSGAGHEPSGADPQLGVRRHPMIRGGWQRRHRSVTRPERPPVRRALRREAVEAVRAEMAAEGRELDQWDGRPSQDLSPLHP
jgi:hypothetical protein